jgi:hypothetical protein
VYAACHMYVPHVLPWSKLGLTLDYDRKLEGRLGVVWVQSMYAAVC